MEVNVALLIVGIIFFATGALLTYGEIKRRISSTEPAEAEVCRYIEDVSRSHGGDHHISVVFFPVFRYCVKDEWYEVKGNSASSDKPYAIGENVAILYNPKNPESFVIAGEKTTVLAFAACIVIGIGIIAAAFNG